MARLAPPRLPHRPHRRGGRGGRLPRPACGDRWPSATSRRGGDGARAIRAVLRNGAWLCCAVLAHNLIRCTVTVGLPRPVEQLTVARTVRTCLLAVPGRLVNRS